jgi:hypothetical protein
MSSRILPHPPTRPALGLLFAALLLAGCGRQPLAPATTADDARSGAARSTGASGLPDDAGAAPAPAADNLDPVLQIVLPHPSALLAPVVPPTFTVRWEASDPDARSSRPLEYRYLLLDDEFELITFLVDPDSLRRRDGPRFESWTRVPGNQQELELRDLLPNSRYLLAIVALDEFGGFNPVFSLRTNMLLLLPVYASTFGPRLDITGDIQFATPVGGLLDDPALAPHFTIPMDQPTSLHWTAIWPPLDDPNGTRWALDPRTFDDISHGGGKDGGWSGWGPGQDGASVGPFASPGEHRFYIEARTKLGLLTRLLLILDVVATAEATKSRAG